MSLYIGGVKIAGGSGSGNANIVSCDSYEDYMSKSHDPQTLYVTPDEYSSTDIEARLSTLENIISENTLIKTES